MTGETNLGKLIATMVPHLHEGQFVFCSVTDDAIGQDNMPVAFNDIICLFREAEGTTLVLRRELADSHGLKYPLVASWITLTVHSSLGAVGLTAAFSKALSDRQISCNVIAAYYHDHIFVQAKDGERAMQILRELSAKYL